MNINDIIQNGDVDFTGIDSPHFLVGLISAFENRFQATADSSMQEISWKQFFALICISMCKTPPSINELADIIGSSHQNVKQILLKLEKKGFVRLTVDGNDKRKQRIELTAYCAEFCANNDDKGMAFMSKLFHGISEDQLLITIQTILKMEENLKEI